MPDKLILLTYESWADLDRAVKGLTAEEAMTRHDGSSRIAWTVGHVTNMVDSWINMRFQRLPPHPVISLPMFRTGASGETEDWATVVGAVEEVRKAARQLLDAEQGPDLDRVIPYDGSVSYLRSAGLSLRYALMRIAAHHFLHAGEIVTVRARLGHVAEELPEWGRSLV